ncbi:DUF1753-domain-containing protein [Lepidopterella palustris CBS 459.81]|uniref:DUF1753-domain-containing protein n=1 Tax=Lepidopterella palustris CBS 459.81 TaxID=1314670 RepID=A0A8E2EAT0_9PEZI|nr:DUF1753-domain-containing protein [Lepidopterella palustris CBS 459.81]
MTPLHLFEIPRPKTFLHTMTLRTGAEIITFLQLINKVSGFYGILALLTGAPLSPLQFSMYLYSLLALIATMYLYPHIRKGTLLPSLALAHLYAIDTVVNALYTAAFGFAWFYVLASSPTSPDDMSRVPGAPGINKTAGFTNPTYNVSAVTVVAAPAKGQDAVAVGTGPPTTHSSGLGNAVFQTGSILSITTIALLWAFRVYFVFVLLAYARQILRQHIATTSSAAAWAVAGAPTDNLAENPFAEGREDGENWRGKLGRIMLGAAPRYWLGADEEGEWMRGMGGKFRRSGMESNGVVERERRRRSGTGPKVPPPQLGKDVRLAELSEVR